MRYLLCLSRITGPAVSVSVLPAGEHSFVALFSASLCLKFAWMQGDTQTVKNLVGNGVYTLTMCSLFETIELSSGVSCSKDGLMHRVN